MPTTWVQASGWPVWSRLVRQQVRFINGSDTRLQARGLVCSEPEVVSTSLDGARGKLVNGFTAYLKGTRGLVQQPEMARRGRGRSIRGPREPPAPTVMSAQSHHSGGSV